MHTYWESNSIVAHARLASGLTTEDAARITGMSQEDYVNIEARPLQLTVGELRALCRELNADGRHIMKTWLDCFFGLS